VFHRELVILPSMHFTVGVSGGIMSGPGKRPRLLTPSKLAELIVDIDSDEAGVSSDISSVEGGSESVPGVSRAQLLRQAASCHESNSSVLSSACDKEDARESWSGEQIQQPVTLQWTRPSCPHSSVVHTYINDDSSPLSIFLLFFIEIITLLVVEIYHYYHDYVEIITLLVVEIYHYYHDYVDRLDDRRFPERDVTEAEMFLFLALTEQM